VFGAYKQGFLSGGFNSSSVNFRASPAVDISYNPEKIKGFEVGVKSLLLDGTLAVNAAAYSYKVTDLQVTNFVNATNTIRNAGAVKIDGVEADFNYKTPLEGFGLHGAVAYNKGKYTSFVGAPCYNGQTIALGCTIIGGNPQQDLSGTELIRAPKVNASFGIGYDTPIGAALKIGLTADVTYSDSYLTDASSAPQSRNPSYSLIDAGVRLGDQNDIWQVAFIGRNLSNKHYWVASPNVPFTGGGQGTNAGTLGDRFAGVSRGRELLFQVSYQFGK
jgi:iron complex outermembrane receptor protein